MYINTTTSQYPVSEAEIRAAYPNTSFATPFQPPEDYAVVFPAPQPAFDPITQGVREIAPELTNKGWYEQRWETYALDAATIAANQAAADKALYDGIVAATQQRLDTFAQGRGYDSILSACTYASSSVVKFATEGQYCVDARDATWEALLTMLAEVQAGTRPRPSGYADIEAELPPLVWP